jgi:hypothetical protein
MNRKGTPHRSRWLRSADAVRESALWPSDCAAGQEHGRRVRAVSEVLRRIPEKDYRRLGRMAGRFLWFVPPTWRFAGLYAFPWTVREADRQPHARVLYLSPTLERRAFDLVVAVVAHELAHVLLRHKLFVSLGEYAAQEREVFRLLCRWGFAREAQRHRAEWTRRSRRKGPNPLMESLERR